MNPTILPTPISDVSLAFSADALDYMPAWDEIPDEFKSGRNPWRDLVSIWLHAGMSEHFSYVPVTVDGGEVLDGKLIFRQLQAIAGSFAPKHEHKVAAMAYLASLWMACAFYGPPNATLEEHTVVGEGFPRDEWIAQKKAEADGD